MLIALTSANGSPGVSTTALALALYRQDFTLLVEADPVGSSPTLSGYLRSEIGHRRSIKNLIDPDRIGALRSAIGDETIRIPNTKVSVLPGLIHAGQAKAMTHTWSHLTEQLVRYAETTTVVVDAGRMGSGPMEVMRQADLIGILVRPRLPEVAALASALVPFTEHLTTHKSQTRLGLIVVGDKLAHGTNTYDATDIAKSVGVDLIATVPDAPKAAAVFSTGASMTRWQQRRSRYFMALRGTWPQIESFTHAHRPWVAADGFHGAPTPMPAGATR